ncbi:sickle tail protein homolog [Austrofundulus limnaeus]|uniref:Sickle tail protein homolog n=1 Tax=Austrofundulus limnaeus TaxID=52670 RepID=A0A2I4BNK5_AUSLI|nr:PREDICTED: sickle tail protein homolog [Austrofundulus limnaeus]
MSKSFSHLGRTGPAGCKSHSLKKELHSNPACMLRIGERLMKAGSEGNLVHKPTSTQNQSQTSSDGLQHKHQQVLKEQNTKLTANNSRKDPHSSPSTLPRSYVYSSTPASRESQHSDMERKREVFLEHLKQKYPNHAAIIMGHSDSMRDQVRSIQSSGVVGLVEEQDPLALEIMADEEVMSPSAHFLRGCRSRSSLPAGRLSQTRDRPKGVLYLQYGEETKLVRMPPPEEISCQDSVRALFVIAFPDQLNMKMLQSPNMAIYIKDTNRNIYYNLEDVRNITSSSCLKAYHKDPAQVFNRHANAEGRISKEVLYGRHSPVHRRSSGRSTLQGLQGSMSPPLVRSMPSSPSRMAYGGWGTHGGKRVVDPGSSALPSNQLSGGGQSSGPGTSTTSTSAILERRDIRPDSDADLGSSKSTALVLRKDEGAQYSESYSSSPQERGVRLRISSSLCSAPPILTTDAVDSGVLGIPGGLQQYRASVKPLMGFGETKEHQTRSIHRQRSRKYGDSQLPAVGIQTPPPSPHRVSEGRTLDGQMAGSIGQMSPERKSSLRRSLRRSSHGFPVEILNRDGSLSSSMSPVFMDSPQGQLFHPRGTPSYIQSERMNAMEEQIASLAGLVHHALSMGSDVSGAKDSVSQSSGNKHLNNQLERTSDVQNPNALMDVFSPPPPALQDPPSDRGLRQSLVSAKRKICELRLQLSQLKCLQLSNLDSVSSMLRMAGQELLMLMAERLAQAEVAAYSQRAEVEEDRVQYVFTEEKLLTQLSELEGFVEYLRSSVSSPVHSPVTMKDVEEGAVSLRRIGEALAILKGEFPVLQAKMRSVLRLEVEAVRFLKEEPLKMDSMLKRVKALTETLSSLRRHLSESATSARSTQVESFRVLDQGLPNAQNPCSSPKPQPRYSIRSPLPMSQADDSFSEAHRLKSAAVTEVQLYQHLHNFPLTHEHDSPTGAKGSPCSRKESPALRRKVEPQQFDGLNQHKPALTQENLLDQTTTAERQTPEGSLSPETSSVNQSRTTQENQPPDCDSSQTQLLGIQSDGPLTGSVSGPVAPLASEPDQDKPQNGTTQVSQFPAAAEPLPVGSPRTERSWKPQVEKPRRSGVDSDRKQNQDRVKVFPPFSGSREVTSGKSQVTHSSTEPAGAQKLGDQAAPQPKPPRQLQEVQPKPPTSDPASSRSTCTKEGEGNEMKKLQASAELSNRNNPPDGFKQNSKGKRKTSPSKVSKATFTNNSSVSSDKLKDFHRDGSTRGFKHTEKKVMKPLSALIRAVVEEQISPPGAPQTSSVLEPPCVSVQTNTEEVTSQKRGFLKNTPDQTNKDKVERIPNTDVAVVVSLRKGKSQACPEPQNQTANSEAAEKSNLTVLITLEKKPTAKHRDTEPLPDLQQNESPSTTAPKPLPSSSSKQQNQEETVQVPKVQSLSNEEENSLRSDIWIKRDPTSPLSTHDSDSGVSKVNTGTKSRKEKTDNMNDFIPVNSTGQPVCFGHKNHGFEDNDESTYMSSIVEYEEDMDRVLEKTETTCNGEEEGVRETPFANTRTGQGPPDSPENGQNSPRPSVLNISNSENQIQDQTLVKMEAKSIFKFKFPKNKLAALSQAFRPGTNKIAKKTPEPAVAEKKMVSDCRPIMETEKQTKESKSSELSPDKDASANTRLSKSNAHVEALCKGTFQSINSLEESIKQLEISMDAITSPPNPTSIVLSPSDHQNSSQDPSVGAPAKDKHKRERSSSKRSATQTFRNQNPPQTKRAKAPSPHHSGRTGSRKQSSSSTTSPSAHQNQTKVRTSSSGSSEKRPEGQQQTSQKPPSQPHHAASAR